MSFLSRNLYALLAMALMAMSGAVQAQDETAVILGRQEIREATEDTLATLYEYQPTARHAVEHAAGYAVFSTFGIKQLFSGGQQGKGVVVNNRTNRHTFMKMVGTQTGLGFAVPKTRLVFIFETANALQAFINQGWEFGPVGALSASGAASVSPGVSVYQITDRGLAVQITATGTKFFKDTALN